MSEHRQIIVPQYEPPKKENNLVPTNVIVSHPYIRNTLDICWDDMMPMSSDLVGYNIYRSQVDAQYLQNIVSQDSITSDHVYSVKDTTFVKINKTPITTTFYRDKALNVIVLEEDVSEQFRFRTPIDVRTEWFKGQIVDEHRWQAQDPDRLINQSDGIHFTDVYGNNREAFFQSKFYLHKEFDIETHFKIFNWPETAPTTNAEVALIVSLSRDTYIKLSRFRTGTTDYYVSTLIVDSKELNRTAVPTTDLECRFRIVRGFEDVSVSYYDGTTWVLIISYLEFSFKDLQVCLYAKSSDKPIDAQFFFFHVEQGKTVLPLIKDVRGDYNIQVKHYPIVTEKTDTTTNLDPYSDKPDSVQVIVDGRLATIKSVDGLAGIVKLETERVWDDILQRWIEPVVPHHLSIVSVSYMYMMNSFRMNLTALPHYKITALLNDGSETRLEWCEPVKPSAEKLDYIYLEAIRRNSWLLDQAGERVLLFIRKTTGIKCECYKEDERTHRQAKVGPCKKCWGTAFVGGYEGPYEIRISPFQAEQKIMWTERGMKLENIEQTWTTISPTITQRDFIVRRKGQIYAIGPISAPEVKGIVTQQHFSVESVDMTDIRYTFITTLNLFGYKQKVGLRQPYAHYTEDIIVKDGELQEADRLRTDKGTSYTDKKGRNLQFENELF
jgi:hypothetical protein